MTDAYDGSSMPRRSLKASQLDDLKAVFEHAAYLPGFSIECGGSAKAWRTTNQLNVLINVVRQLAVRYRVPFITSKRLLRGDDGQLSFRARQWPQ